MTGETRTASDVMVDVTPRVTVYRAEGVWRWRAEPATTQEDVARELEFQLRRLETRAAYLREALRALTSP